MEEREAFQLLTLASARDGRTVSQATARVWASDLERIALVDAVQAAQLHYRESTDWLMPAHVIKNAVRVRNRREREARLARPAVQRAEITLDRAKFEEETRAAAEQWRIGRRLAGMSEAD